MEKFYKLKEEVYKYISSEKDKYLRDGKAGMPIPYRGGMKALFVLLVCNVSFYCFFRDMSDALAIIRTRPQCREAAP